MNLTAHLPAGRRQHVEARLHGKLLAWLTTVRPDGQPDTVPVWFLVRDDDTILIYSRPGRERPGCATRENPHVALGLDVTDIGRDVIRQDALLAVHGDVQPPGQDVPGIVGFPVPVQRRPGEPRAELHLDHTEPFIGLCPPELNRGPGGTDLQGAATAGGTDNGSGHETPHLTGCQLPGRQPR